MKSRIFKVITGLSTMILFSCGNGVGPRKNLVGGYELQQFTENHCYYLEKEGSLSPVGIIEGIVETIGWSDTYLVIEMRSIYGKDGVREPNFWIVVDLRSDEVTSDLTAEELENLDLQIDMAPVEQVWGKL